MKKLKILPAVLMLVLCVGVLAVGVFAITPTKNTISGTVTVNASNEPVTITVCENNASGKILASAEVRAGKTIQVGSLKFKTENANTIDQVAPIKLAVVFSTTSNEKLVIDTETVEGLNGITENSQTVKDVVSVTKLHSYTQTEQGLACFTNGADYTITCTFRLVDFVNEKLTVRFDLNFDIYKASEYTGEGINGVDYLRFGSFPQTEAPADEVLTLVEGKAFEAYDDATGGKIQRAVYADSEGNEYVQVENVWVDNKATEETKYYKFEPLKWRILTEENGTALLMCENIVEQVQYKNANNYKVEGNTYYVLDKNGEKILNEETTNSLTDYIYANNYAYSDLRAYLIDTFYNGAFNSLQKQLIQETALNNKTGEKEKNDFVITTNSCAEATENTNDYVFALSYDDVVNGEYNFAPLYDSNKTFIFDIERMIKNTGYSTATGVKTEQSYKTKQDFIDYHKSTNCECGGLTFEGCLSCSFGNYEVVFNGVDPETYVTKYYSNAGPWWLRSPHHTYSFGEIVIAQTGSGANSYVNSTYFGCVPALHISL